MNIDIIGGGPSGLYLALLLRRHRPDWRVRVFEQNARGATFGFGVVLADSGLQRLFDADPETHDRLVAAMRFADRQIIVHRDTPIEVKSGKTSAGAITRIELLEILASVAEARGVRIEHLRRMEVRDVEAAVHDADLVVGADGVHSIVRRMDEAGFGTTSAPLCNRFAWYGTTKVFEHPALVFRRHGQGCFVAHYYPYSARMSTFVAECDARTWEAEGLADMSDTERLALAERLFAKELEGHRLVSNHSGWKPFQVVRNARMVSGRKVLIGDAHASAHPTIGSGTRIAMEDAISLANALLGCDGNVAAALVRHEQARAPPKGRPNQNTQNTNPK
jgi:2-polyprenyl-6-methoxyphenol hydroxylase-like FAD-dependent oxidoreductase